MSGHQRSIVKPGIFLLLGVTAIMAEPPHIFPQPQQVTHTGATFRIDDETIIALSAQPTSTEVNIATILMRELSDRHGLAVKAVRGARRPYDGRVILLGSISNPLVKAEAEREGLSVTADSPGPEGYALRVNDRMIIVAGTDDAGAFYGVQSLRQLIRRNGETGRVSGVDIRDWPEKPFRGIRLFLPGRDNLGFFRRFVADFMGLYKFNKLIVEVGAGMRLERHPELNAGVFEFAHDMETTRRDRPKGPRGEFQDASHYDIADGGVLEKDEVASIVRLANENHIEVIPEIPSLTHSYYLLTHHRELAEVPTAEWPDTYCPSNPKSYELLFDVLDEYIDVMRPRMIHAGHDEWRIPVDLCSRCKDKDHTELFLADLRKIHEYLAAKDIQMAIWGDHLIEPLRGRGLQAGAGPNAYQVPGALSEDQVRAFVPKDILIFNWFWGDDKRDRGEEETNRATEGSVATGEINDIRLENWGFEQVYGNFKPWVQNYEARRKRRGVLGGAASWWSAVTEFNLGKEMIHEFAGTAPMLWSKRQIPEEDLLHTVQSMIPDIRRRMSGQDPRSSLGDAIRIVPVGATGAASIPINEDASSLIFVHAAAKPGRRDKAYKMIHNAADTADLIGVYQIVYKDGLVESVPLRYAWNILDRTWPRTVKETVYCYAADARTSAGGALFAYEWPNSRRGVMIKEVRLQSLVESNPITLESIEIVGKRTFPDPIQARRRPLISLRLSCQWPCFDRLSGEHPAAACKRLTFKSKSPHPETSTDHRPDSGRFDHRCANVCGLGGRRFPAHTGSSACRHH